MYPLLFIELGKLLAKIFKEIALTQIIVFASILLIVLIVRHIIEPKPKPEQKTIETIKEVYIEKQQPLIKPINNKPIIIYSNDKQTSYPNYHKVIYNKPTPHINDIIRELNNYHPNIIHNQALELSYISGQKQAISETIHRLKSIKPSIIELNEDDLIDRLIKLDLNDELTVDEKTKLYTLAQENLQKNDELKSRFFDQFIRDTLSTLNPEKYETFQTNKTVQIHYDLKIGQKYNHLTFESTMNQYKGRIANIDEIVHVNEHTIRYRIDIDHGEHLWSSSMFEVL